MDQIFCQVGMRQVFKSIPTDEGAEEEDDTGGTFSSSPMIQSSMQRRR